MKAYYTTQFIKLKEEYPDVGLESVEWDATIPLYAYKDRIIKRFNEYYALYEIGSETKERFQFMVKKRFTEYQYKWNHLITLYENNIIEQIGRVYKYDEVIDTLRNISESRHGAAGNESENDGTLTSTQGETVNSEMKDYDTPVSGGSNLQDGYLTSGTGATSSHNKNGTDTSKTTNKSNSIYQQSMDNDKTENVKINKVQSYQDETIMELIYKNYDKFEDVVQRIINDLEPLFINVVARW